MPQTRKDDRLAKWICAVVAVFAPAGYFAYLRVGTAAAAGTIALSLSILAGLIIRSMYFYRCPTCRRPLQLMDSEATTSQSIRHHCPKCDVTWDTGITIGSSTEL